MENNFFKKLPEQNKIQCLECNKQLSGLNISNIKRHYKLIHKKYIKQNGEVNSDDDTAEPIAKKPKLNFELDKNEFLKCCVGMVTVKNLPFRIFDDDQFFKKLISPWENKFNTNLNSRNIVTALETSSEHIKNIIAKRVKAKMVSLKLSIATRMDKSILGINIQYIKDFKICINTIGMIQLQKKHIAPQIKEEIVKCLKTYSIQKNQIYSITTDNGAKVIKASKILQEEQEEFISDEFVDIDDDDQIHLCVDSVLSIVRCPAQSIHLAAYDVLKHLEIDIVQCREHVKKFRKSINSAGIGLKMPILDNATRWKTTYDMMDSLLNLKKKDLIFIESINVNWDFIENFVRAFQPLAECTKELQTSEHYIIGDFYRDWLSCELKLQHLIPHTPYAEELYSAMERRKRQLLENDAFNAALYLDPRFNFVNSVLLSEDQRCKAVAHLLKTYEILKKFENNQGPQNPLEIIKSEYPISQMDDETPSTSKKSYSILEQHVSMQMFTSTTSETQRTMKQKLLLLSNNQKVSFDTDVLKHWRNNNFDEDIKKLVEVCLAVPATATQVSIERAFSALSLLITKWRSKLKSESINDLLITKLNFNEIIYKPIAFDITDIIE